MKSILTGTIRPHPASLRKAGEGQITQASAGRNGLPGQAALAHIGVIAGRVGAVIPILFFGMRRCMDNRGRCLFLCDDRRQSRGRRNCCAPERDPARRRPRCPTPSRSTRRSRTPGRGTIPRRRPGSSDSRRRRTHCISSARLEEWHLDEPLIRGAHYGTSGR